MPPHIKEDRGSNLQWVWRKGLYNACYSMKAAETRILRTKSKLCARLYMYSVSLHKGETIEALNTIVIINRRHFRERWGEENGFKGININSNWGLMIVHRLPAMIDGWSVIYGRIRGILLVITIPCRIFIPTPSKRAFSWRILPEIRINPMLNFPPISRRKAICFPFYIKR